MRLSHRSAELGSLLALAGCLGLAASGCFVFRDESPAPSNDQQGSTPPATTTTPEQVIIDADATLQSAPGQGVGLFVEYSAGGRWTVFATCDYDVQQGTPQACGFDVFATSLVTGAALTNPQGTDLAGKDKIELQPDGAVHLFAEVAGDTPGMTFESSAGDAVEFDVYLDGNEDARFIYWVGRGVLHQGAPTDPIDMAPSTK
jgi:hypothetical protein